MDKYQEYLVEELRVSAELAEKREVLTVNPRSASKSWEYDTTAGLKSLSFCDGTITLIQNDNYHLHLYELKFSHPKIRAVQVSMGKGNHLVAAKKIVRHGKPEITDVTWVAEVDFDNKASHILLSFEDDIVDPIKIPLVFVDADKAAWDAKIEAENRKHLAEAVNLVITKGDSLINVLFQPVDDRYSRSAIKLFYVYTDPENQKHYQFMGEFYSSEGLYFIPICNLGYGSYGIEYRQYAADGSLIYEADRMEFAYHNPGEATAARIGIALQSRR